MSSTSAWTDDSVFADAAISNGRKTPVLVDFRIERLVQSDVQFDKHVISARLTELAAIAWAAEEDALFCPSQRQNLQELLEKLEASLEDRSRDDDSTEPKEIFETTGTPSEAEAEEEEEPGDGVDEMYSDALRQIHEDLAATVATMRLRQQEQKHIHRLSVQKLDTVARRCLTQDKQLEDLRKEARKLRKENRRLGRNNDDLCENVIVLEAESRKKDVAINAMTSAVAGLEGWLEATQSAQSNTQSILKHQPLDRYVIRGRGRFRGRYYIEDDEDSTRAYSTLDVRDLHDGVKAWVRGFRDVEEELTTNADVESTGIQGGSDEATVEVDWGGFETVSESSTN